VDKNTKSSKNRFMGILHFLLLHHAIMVSFPLPERTYVKGRGVNAPVRPYPLAYAQNVYAVLYVSLFLCIHGPVNLPAADIAKAVLFLFGGGYGSFIRHFSPSFFRLPFRNNGGSRTSGV
jgi:hypothetical protein